MIGTHVITNADPHACNLEVEKFCDKKTVTLKQWGTVGFAIGMAGGQMNIQFVVTCFIQWETTEEDWKSFVFSQQLRVSKS